jgi:hypothetical protein
MDNMFSVMKNKTDLIIESESGSISQRHGSADQDPDPDPHHNFMDLEHC